MKSFRHYLEIAFTLCVLTLLAGCSSPLQQADKLTMSDPGAAISAYQQIMDTNPDSEEARRAHLGIANTYYKRMDNSEKGLEEYEKVAEKYSGSEISGEANWALGMHYFQAKDYERARENFKKVTEEMPDTQKANDAALAMGKCYEELKKYEEAAKVYTEFAKTHPTHRRAAQAGLDAARIYDRELGKTDEAVETYKYVASEYSISSSGREAREALADMGVDISDLTEQPETEAQQTQAQAGAAFGTTTRRRARNVPRSEFGGRQGAEQQSRSSVSPDFGVDPIELMPIVTGGADQGTMYDAMYMFANMNLQSGQYKEAGALYEKAIQLAGDRKWDGAGGAYYGLAKSYKGIGMDDKAREMFKEAIGKDRKVIDRMIVSGETQYGEEEYEEALETYRVTLGLVPHRDSEIYYNIGLVYQKLGDADKELEAFERSVALKPNFTDAIQHVAEVLYYRKKDATRADLYDREARGQGNTDYAIQKELGDLCYKYGSYSWSKIKYNNATRLAKREIDSKLKEAMESETPVALKQVSEAAASGDQKASEALQKIAPLLADYRVIGSRVAISQVRMKQNDQAQQQLDKFKEDDPDASGSADFRYALGELALAQGDKAAGLAEIKKALEIDPQHKEAADRLKELESQEAS